MHQSCRIHLEDASVDAFKDAIFMYEPAGLPPDLQMIATIAEKFQTLPASQTTLLNAAHTLDEAAVMIDGFKAKTCGSAYSVAVININKLNHVEELKFLMRLDVLGDPRSIFLASLRYMTGDIYAFAKEKVERESEDKSRSPSCISCYGSVDKDQTCTQIAELLGAYLFEIEERAKARREGTSVFGSTPAEELMKKSHSAIYGKRSRSTRPLSPGGPGSLPAPGQ
jgi:hypothetical protein